MISVMALTEAISEGTARAINNVPTYRFATDNIMESSAEFSYSIASNCADFNEMLATTDEILTEAVLSGSPNVYSLDENVFTSIKDRAIEIIKNIIEKVKGMWEQLKAYYFKLRQKTTKWAAAVEPEVGKITSKPGYNDFQFEMNKWNVPYVTSTSGKCIVGAVSTLMDDWKNLVTDVKGVDELRGNLTKSDEDDADVENTVNTMKNSTEEMTNAQKDAITENIPDSVRDALGLSAGVDVANKTAFLTAVRVLAHGGDDGKSLHKPSEFGGPDKMLQAVKASTDTVKKLEEAYSTHINALNDYLKKMQNRKTLDFGKNSNVPGKIQSAVRDFYKAYYNYNVNITSGFETYIDKLKTLNIKLISEMNTEFMNALTKMMGLKAEKAPKESK